MDNSKSYILLLGVLLSSSVLVSDGQARQVDVFANFSTSVKAFGSNGSLTVFEVPRSKGVKIKLNKDIKVGVAEDIKDGDSIKYYIEYEKPGTNHAYTQSGTCANPITSASSLKRVTLRFGRLEGKVDPQVNPSPWFGCILEEKRSR